MPGKAGRPEGERGRNGEMQRKERKMEKMMVRKGRKMEEMMVRKGRKMLKKLQLPKMEMNPRSDQFFLHLCSACCT